MRLFHADPTISSNGKARSIAVVVMLMGACFSVSAKDDLYRVDETVVTATRTEKALMDVPVRTEVVTNEQIQRQHARDLQEALKYVPGLMLKKIHGKSGSSAWLQGMDSERVLILIDGEPVSASTGSTVDLSQISTAEIERIEVVKGAASVLYGSAAMGGVINVITRRVEQPLAWSLTVDGGSWGDDNLDDANAVPFRHVGANVALRRKKWSLLAATDIRDSDGYDLDQSTFATQGDAGTKYNLHTRFTYYPDDSSEIYLSPKYYREDIQSQFATPAPGTSLGEIRKNKNELAERATLMLGGKKSYQSNARIRGFLVFEQFTDDTEQDVISTAIVDQRREAQIDTAKLDLQWDQPIGDDHTLTLGAVYFEESLEQIQQRLQNGVLVSVDEIEENAGRDNVELYAQDDIFISDTVELLMGGRAQEDSDFGGHFAPKVSLLFSPDWFAGAETRLRASAGRGYRVPNLKERYFIFDHSSLGYMVFGNDDLQPEKSLNYQLGLEVIAKKHRFDINFFYSDIDELIETDISPVQSQPGILLFEYLNIANARIQGAELGWGQQFGDHWHYSAAYTYLDTEDRATGNRLPERSEHQIKTELRFEYHPWELDASLHGIYQSDEFVDVDNSILSPGWTTWDLKFNKKINKSLKVFFGIENLTNKHRERFDGTDNRPEEGRFFYTGVRYSH